MIQADKSSHLSSAKTFQELDLPKHLLEAIFAMGFDRPSAIQEEALPRILSDPPRNLIGQAQSGSGKTAAFTLGMLYRIEVDIPATTQAICVTPTRELAVQIVQKAVTPMAANMEGLKVRMALAGEMIERGSQADAHLIVGTPGKIVDWLKRRFINPANIKVFVLDEADNMVGEDGHRANSLLIKKTMPKTCQCLLFSATFPHKVVEFATKMVNKPDKILIETEEHLVSEIFGREKVNVCLFSFSNLLCTNFLFVSANRCWMLSNRCGLTRSPMMVERGNFWQIFIPYLLSDSQSYLSLPKEKLTLLEMC